MKKYITIAGIIIACFLVNNYFTLKREAVRETSNRENLQKEILGFKNDMIQLRAGSDEEFEKYLDNTSDQLKGLKDKIKESDIKLKNILRVVSTSISYRDSVSNIIVLDSISLLVKSIKAQLRDPLSPVIVYPFEENNPCFWFKAKLIIDGEIFKIEIEDRGYNDTITHIGFLEKRQWKLLGIIKTRFLGKKIAKITMFNNCGDSKTFIIDGKRKQ